MMHDESTPNGPDPVGSPDSKSARRDRARRELESWRESAALAGTGDAPSDRLAILDALLGFLGRLDELAAEYRINLSRGGEGMVTMSVAIPESSEEVDPRGRSAVALLRSWREQGDDVEQAEALEILERGLGPRHFPGAHVEP